MAEFVNQFEPNRRQFLTLATLASAGIVLQCTNNIAIAKANTLEPFPVGPYNSQVWKANISNFVNHICEPQVARQISDVVNRCQLDFAPAASTFHSHFSAPVILVGWKVSPSLARCDHFFALDGFPMFDIDTPCREIKDLNSAEMLRLTYPKEVAAFGCVMAPCNERQAPTMDDQAAFNHVARNRYDADPNEFSLQYVRPFNNGGKAFNGYGVRSKPRIDSNNRPKSDLLLSADDI